MHNPYHPRSQTDSTTAPAGRNRQREIPRKLFEPPTNPRIPDAPTTSPTPSPDHTHTPNARHTPTPTHNAPPRAPGGDQQREPTERMRETIPSPHTPIPPDCRAPGLARAPACADMAPPRLQSPRRHQKTPQSDLRIYTINAKGLNSPQKRARALRGLKSLPLDPPEPCPPRHEIHPTRTPPVGLLARPTPPRKGLHLLSPPPPPTTHTHELTICFSSTATWTTSLLNDNPHDQVGPCPGHHHTHLTNAVPETLELETERITTRGSPDSPRCETTHRPILPNKQPPDSAPDKIWEVYKCVIRGVLIRHGAHRKRQHTQETAEPARKVADLEKQHKSTLADDTYSQLVIARAKLNSHLSQKIAFQFRQTQKTFNEYGNKSRKLLARALRKTRQKSFISEIKHNGTTHNTPKSIAEGFRTYYEALYNLHSQDGTGEGSDTTKTQKCNEYLTKYLTNTMDTDMADAMEEPITAE
ncbi:Hypothetical predicted protein [Pelobates cultripes]|uniref:Uncharacterized protein n=1 Tax=Pelobates cultripes TaxID=61616 RepID=A0AAD1SR98_PELCU|nr:Hypothetical predicted protein [Pelobates cultripes]